MWNLELDFINQQSEQTTLEWSINKSFGSVIWLNSLQENIKKNKMSLIRFLGFHSNRNKRAICELINQQIDIINKDQNNPIKHKASIDGSQELFNSLHHYFEILHGPGVNARNEYRQLSKEVKAAVNNLNYLVHEMESFDRSKEGGIKAITFEFNESERIPIPKMCDNDFTLETKFGDIVLHYTQVGKTWWEVFLDGDEEIFDEAIIPHLVIDGSFDIFFGSIGNISEIKEEFFEFLRKNNKDPFDSSLRLGFHPVATLKTNVSDDFFHVNQIKMLKIFKEGKCLIEHMPNSLYGHVDASFIDD